MSQDQQQAVRIGVLSSLLAYTIWGFFPIYFFNLRGVPADEVLTHRIIWAVPAGMLIIHFRRQWPDVLKGLSSPKVLGILAAAAMTIALNWLVYIYAVQSQRTLEASLGYYINPLFYVAVGVVVMKERLRAGQWVAVALALIGVMVLTIYGGRFPLISLILASSFTAYGYLRKRVDIGAMPGLLIETLLLAPIALAYLTYLFVTGTPSFAAADWGGKAYLILAGPLTVTPLLFFAIGARRLTLATLGFLQFLGPTLQFVIALWDGEAFTRAHQICFAIIWLAVAIFATDAWRNRPSRIAKQRPIEKDAGMG